MLIAQITDAHIVPKGTHWKGEPATEIPDRLTRAVACLNSRLRLIISPILKTPNLPRSNSTSRLSPFTSIWGPDP